MKTITLAILTLVFSIFASHAEMSPWKQRSFQEKAAEKIEIQIQKAEKLEIPDGYAYKVVAKVVAVEQSTSGLNIGDKIEIHYQKSNVNEGSYPSEVEQAKLYKAYLRLDTDTNEKKKVYRGAAGSGTFIESGV